VLLAWAEGTGWNQGGKVGWQLFDENDRPTPVKELREGLPVWSLPAVYAEPDGDFVVLY
jgi:hypothetical protein